MASCVGYLFRENTGTGAALIRYISALSGRRYNGLVSMEIRERGSRDEWCVIRDLRCCVGCLTAAAVKAYR